MAKAAVQHTPHRYYSEEVRTEMRKHVERVLARRKSPRPLDLDWVWDDLETAARIYFSSLKSCSLSPSITDATEGLDKCRAHIDNLLRELKKPALSNWNFISDSNDPFCRILKPGPLRDV